MDQILLTGTLCASTQTSGFTGIHPGPSESSFFPFSGDLQLTLQIDPAVYKLPNEAQRCQGACVLAVFDGVPWRRFDIASITSAHRFKSPAQLLGVERWVRHVLASNTGRACAWASGVNGACRLPAPLPVVDTSRVDAGSAGLHG